MSSFFLIKERQRAVTRVYGLYTFLISLWSLSWFLMIYSTNPVISLFWARFLHIPAAIIPATFLHFAQLLQKKEADYNHKLLRYFFYGVGFIFILITFRNDFVPSISKKLGGHFYLNAGNLYWIFMVVFVIEVLIIHWILYTAYREETGFKRTQVGLILVAYALGYGGGACAFLPVYNIHQPTFAFYTIPLCHIMITYATVRYRALDVNLVIRWGMAYGISFILVMFLFFLGTFGLENYVTDIFKLKRGLVTIISASIVALLFEPIKKIITRFVDKFIFKSPDYRLILDNLKLVLDKSHTLNVMTSNLIDNLKKTYDIEHGGIAVWSTNKSIFELYPENSFRNQLIDKMKIDIGTSDFLVKTLESERRLFNYGIVSEDDLATLLIRSSAGEKITFEKIRRTMRWLGATICIPLMHNELLLGFIALGQKKGIIPYNEEDKKFLSHVSEMVSQTIKDMVIDNDRYPKIKAS